MSISVTTTDRRLTLMSPRWNSSLFIDDDIPVLDVVTDAPAEPVDSCFTVHGMLPQTTSNMGLMSVSDDKFLSFLRGHLLCLGLLLFSFYLLFSPFLLSALHSVEIYIKLAILCQPDTLLCFRWHKLSSLFILITGQ